MFSVESSVQRVLPSVQQKVPFNETCRIFSRKSRSTSLAILLVESLAVFSVESCVESCVPRSLPYFQ